MNFDSPIFAVAISVFLSLLPALVWGAIFLHRTHEKRYMLVRTFMLGALMVLPLVFYRQLWDAFPAIDLTKRLEPLSNSLHFLPDLTVGLIILFVTIGIIEEYLKNLVVRKVDRKEIDSVSDAIEFSIVAALGFSFAENTFYFIETYQNLGTEFLLNIFVFRAWFSTFAHILFSSVYGYHLGIALFAKPIYKEISSKSFSKRAILFLHKITNFKSASIFEEQQMFIGLFYAAGLHAIFNILLEMGNTLFLVPFLLLGCIHVSVLIWNKDNNVEY